MVILHKTLDGHGVSGHCKSHSPVLFLNPTWSVRSHWHCKPPDFPVCTLWAGHLISGRNLSGQSCRVSLMGEVSSSPLECPRAVFSALFSIYTTSLRSKLSLLRLSWICWWHAPLSLLLFTWCHCLVTHSCLSLWHLHLNEWKTSSDLPYNTAQDYWHVLPNRW